MPDFQAYCGETPPRFANEAELCSLYEVDDFDASRQRVNHHCEVAALTRSAETGEMPDKIAAHAAGAPPDPMSSHSKPARAPTQTPGWQTTPPRLGEERGPGGEG